MLIKTTSREKLEDNDAKNVQDLVLKVGAARCRLLLKEILSFLDERLEQIVS